MGTDSSTKAQVEIFGAVYRVRGEKDSEHLQELAELVDTKMREIASQVTTVDTARIAILTALNLADELFQCRRGQEGEWIEVEEKAAELTVALTEVLES